LYGRFGIIPFRPALVVKGVLFRSIHRERKMRGTAAVEFEQKLAWQAMDRRVSTATEAIDKSRALRYSITSLQPRLCSKNANERLESVEEMQKHAQELEEALTHAQAVLGGDWDPPIDLGSSADTDSFINSPRRWNV
jgi:hypothetical protein